MKTYKTNEMLGRIIAHLVAMHKPFNFNGEVVEFTASDDFMQRMYNLDPRTQSANFIIR